MAKYRKKRVRQDSIECVMTVPAHCPKCHCTDRTEKESVKTKDIIGTTREGTAYTKVQWNYCNCVECGTRYRFTEYLRPASRHAEKAPVEESFE